MIRDVCLYDKFSYCQNGVRCRRVHLKETCLIRECDYRKCNKRHPRPCRFLMLNGFCKFGSSCRYSHRLPKNVEDQNEKIKAIEEEIKVQNEKIKNAENKNVTLEKMVEDQNLTIRKLQLQLSTQYEKEIETLKKDIENLNVANNEKELSIKSITKSLNELEEKVDDAISDDYEDVNEDEPFYSSYVDKALALVDETKDEIDKMRRNTREAKLKVEKLCEELTSLPSKCKMTPISSYSGPIEKLEEFAKSNETKMDKDTCLTKLMDLKNQLQRIAS